LPNAVTLGAACDRSEAPRSSRDMLQWAVDLQQRRRGIFGRKAEVEEFALYDKPCMIFRECSIEII